MPTQSTPAAAASAKTTHSWIPGRGYVAHDATDRLAMGRHRSSCVAPTQPADGSIHLLFPPGGGWSLAFRWIENERAWEPENAGLAIKRGRRLAFTADYLGSHGWKYDQPVRQTGA